MGGKWPYICWFVGCCLQDLLKSARTILLMFPSCFLSRRYGKVQVVQPYNSTDTGTALKNSIFILSVRLDVDIVFSDEIIYSVFIL